MRKSTIPPPPRKECKRGMRTLRTSGLLAIYDGVTTIEEAVRETIVEEG